MPSVASALASILLVSESGPAESPGAGLLVQVHQEILRLGDHGHLVTVR